jgi:hypothetical protein
MFIQNSAIIWLCLFLKGISFLVSYEKNVPALIFIGVTHSYITSDLYNCA